MRTNDKRFFDAGVSKGQEGGLHTWDKGTDGKRHPFIREPKSVAGTTGTYAISESHIVTFSNGLYNNQPTTWNTGTRHAAR
jgi:hypothetical protein